MTTEQEVLLAFVKLVFPRELLDYFEVVSFEIQEENINVQLNERDRILKPKQGHTYVKNGFLPECKITDFPLRATAVLPLSSVSAAWATIGLLPQKMGAARTT